MRQHLIGLVCISLIACVSVTRAQPLADRVPDDAMIYIGWAGSESMGTAYQESHLRAILDHSKIRELFTQFLPAVARRVAQEEPEAEEPMRIAMTLARPMFRYPTALFFWVDLSNPDQPMPKFGLITQAGKDAPAVHKEVLNLLAQAGETPVPVSSFEKDDLVAVVIGFDDPQAALAGGNGEATNAIEKSPAFTAALKQVQADPKLVLYVDVEKLLGEVEAAVQKTDDEQAKQMVPKILDASGLRGLKRIIRTSGFDGPDWMSMTFVEAPAPRAGILGVFESKPVSADLLKAIPPDATFVATARFDAARLIQEIRKAAAEVDPRAPQFIDMGLGAVQMALAKNPVTDILEPMGEDWAAYCSPTVSGNGLLGMVIVNRLDDPAKAQSALPAATINLSNWIGVALQRNDADVEIRARTTKIGDQTVYYFGLPIVAPAWTQKGEYLYLALYPQPAAAAARAGTREDKTFADNEKFLALQKRLGVENPVSFSFYDLPAVAGQGGMYQQWMLVTRYAGFGDLFGVPVPEPLLPPLDVLLQHLGPAGTASWIDDAGFHSKSISPFPGSKLLSEPGMMAGGGGPAGGALMIGILLPSLNRARETANRVKCASNMRQFGQGMMLYANENNGNLPPDMQTLARYMIEVGGSADIFVCPSSNDALPQGAAQMNPGDLAAWAADNSSYIYLGGGKQNNLPADEIVLYESPADHDHDGINALFGDGHVEFLLLPQARQLLEQQGVELDAARR